ncbi:MAG: type II secretion system F family protein [Agathobacter sp.]
MASFKYEIIKPDGKSKKGTIEANTLEQAQSELKSDGSFIVSLKAASALDKDIDIHIGAAVKPRELSVFCRQFESILNAGVTVIDALDMLAEQTENKTFKNAIETVRDDVQKGNSLSVAFSKHPKVFPEIMIHMVNAGEASGSLDIAFNRLGMQFEKESRLKGLIVKSMIYPIILIIVIIVVVIIMMVKIVPTFTSSFAEVGADDLPAITKAVMAVSDFFVNSWFWMAGGIFALWFICHEFKKTERGAMLFGRIALKIPLFGTLNIKTAAATFTRTLSTLTASGIPLVDALGIVEKLMKNAIVKQVLIKAQKEVSEGVALSRPLESSGVFPPMVYHMVRIGEETGNMEDMLDKISEYYDEEVEMATQALLAAMEPLIIIIMALVVVPIVLAIMMPMYSLYNSI